MRQLRTGHLGEGWGHEPLARGCQLRVGGLVQAVGVGVSTAVVFNVPDMAANGRRVSDSDEIFAIALAGGATYAEAGAPANRSEPTVRRRMEDESFRHAFDFQQQPAAGQSEEPRAEDCRLGVLRLRRARATG